MPELAYASTSRRANRPASSSRPLWTDSAPQHPCPRGITTSQPSAASTRAVAAFTSGKKASCTQPVSSPTTARRRPTAGTRSGNRSRLVSGGARDSAVANGSGSSRRPRASARYARNGPRASRIRRGYGNSAKMAARNARSRTGRGYRRSTCCRVSSMSRSYRTPDGHAVTQAMQPRHRSKWVTIDPLNGSPASPCAIRWIRPRGESISCPHSTYVGQVGRQNPQWTQSSIRSARGGWCSSNALIRSLPRTARTPTALPGRTAP